MSPPRAGSVVSESSPVRTRRDSISSITTGQLAHTLDKIHTSASQSDSLTTFNDFAPPPIAAPTSDNKGIAGDLVQQGFSGLYSRLKEAVGGGSSPKSPLEQTAGEKSEPSSKRASITANHGSKASISSLSRVDTGASMSTTSSQVIQNDGASTNVSGGTIEPRPQPQSSKPSSISLMSNQKASSTNRQSFSKKAPSSIAADPTIAPITVHRDPSNTTLRTEDSGGAGSSRKSVSSRVDLQAHLITAESSSSLFDMKEGKLPPKSKRDDTSSIDESIKSPTSPRSAHHHRTPSLQTLQTRSLRSPSITSSLLSPDSVRRKPAVIDRISRSKSPGDQNSRDSSLDRGTAEPSHVSTSAHDSVCHDSFSHNPKPQKMASGDFRIPGTVTSNEEASEQVNAQLNRMRKQVLSKEFWMKDDTVKECFLCQTPFSAFRRKHHCRTCGCIFDSKCTTVISGEKFGVQGSLRVCKRCLEVITRRFDGSGSEDSGDEQSFMPRFFGSNHAKSPSNASQSKPKDNESGVASEGSEDSRPVSRPVTTPMMAIPATRRLGESRAAAILEIDAPQLSRPGSSRSLKSLSARPHSSAGHKRHHSKHGGFLNRFKPAPEERAPFRRGVDDESAKKPKFPAFHDDNIIDPELADYMSDESSEDEQMSLFATMTGDLQPGSLGDDKSELTPYVNANRKYRHRAGEKSISGMSFASRTGIDDLPGSLGAYRRPPRRRNTSNVGGSIHYLPSPRPKSGVYKGPSQSSEMLFALDTPHHSASQITRSDSLQHKKAPKVELNSSSLRHVDKLLHQLLDDAEIPNPPAWQKALVPILLQATDDVDPDVAKGEDMDIRHYVKLKRIPGGKPGDTAYISGVVFTKNLALKSMPRRITNPRIMLVTFPIEYQRHQQHFMSLQPVIEQEKEFLRVVVQRITNLRPHVLLAEKSISGVALQYLSDSNISVAYNVKHTVIEAVARCAETDIISSLDMLALPVQIGRCSNFEVRTFVNNDYPGRKKSYIFLSGCTPELGCTIALRGANSTVLSKVKHIMEFMVYVVYNLKLESSLLRDESIELPEGGESMANSVHLPIDSVRSQSVSSADHSRDGPAVVVNHPASESEPPSQTTIDSSSIAETDDTGSISQSGQLAQDRARLKSLQEQPEPAAEDQTSQVPDDVPMPTYYSDMVAKYETKILSASPYVKFTQPYLLMKAREQERRLLYLRRLRNHDYYEEKGDPEKSDPPRFQLIKPEMVEAIGQKAPRQIMEILRAVHDAEYDKALYNYQTQTRQWETYIQGNLDLFDPYSHQNIVVLYSVICTETKIPCTEPSLVAINFYDEQHIDTGMDPDCTLGQYIEDLAFTMNQVCTSNGCERRMLEHHRTYVHDQSRITVFVENLPNTSPMAELEGITMWTYCKICKKDTEERTMSEATYKYSFGKYLELLFWGRGLKMKYMHDCPHDHHRDHVRYFSLQDARIRIHWDPIDLLEIVVPRARITWKVTNDLKLKNEIFARMEERWAKFMTSVRSRLMCIRIDSVLPEKADLCKSEVDRLTAKAKEDLPLIVKRLQDIYVNSKYYEVVPFNSIVREMLEKAGEWDQAFTKFEADFLSDKDMRQLTIMQLKKMFTDNESKESLTSNEGTPSTVDSEERPSQTFTEEEGKSTQPTEYTDNTSMEASVASSKPVDNRDVPDDDGKVEIPAEGVIERVEPLDLACAPLTPSNPPSEYFPAGEVSEDLEDQETPLALDPEQTPKAPSKAFDTISTDPAEPIPSPIEALPSPVPSLSERVDQMRREQGQSSIPTPTSERAPSRKAGQAISPPMVRATSHPNRGLPRTQSGIGKGLGTKESKSNSSESTGSDSITTPDGSIRVDKKLSDRLGLRNLKDRGKATASGIPRFVHKKRESKVSTLAKHFEQLSREFEKERIRDRKKRAASMRQPRAMLPRTTTKAIVEVYDDVNEAFEEPSPPTDSVAEREASKRAGSITSRKSESRQRTDPVSEPLTPAEPPASREEQEHGNQNQQHEEDEHHQELQDKEQEEKDEKTEKMEKEDNDEHTIANTSQTFSDDEERATDLEHSVPDEYLHDIKEIADSVDASEIPLELPKHQKTSLMKYLTNFWAERGASGWHPLEYPVNPSDHIFVDSDIIVREDEPSSVIALALNSEDYKGKLRNIRREAQETMQRESDSGVDGEPKSLPSEGIDWVSETELEKSLLRVTGTHLKYQFREGTATMTCKIFYAEQFDALRKKCGVAERIVESLSRCLKWDSKGGKTKSVFLKTLDDRLILKSLSPIETSAFLRFAPGYFNIMAEALFHDLPSVIAKMLGFFQVFIKNPVTGTDIKLDLLITENLFYDRTATRIFDLKGSMRNRKIQSTGEQNEVLLDENMVEYIYESPLFAREHSKKLLRASVWNDTLFLARQNVMDYSLMIAVDEARKELVVGIIDCIRTYTWDKKLESWIKDRGFAGGGRNRPTVTSPKEYKSRFREAMARYILQAPNCWHLFNNPQYPHYYGRASLGKEDSMSIELNWETLTSGPDGDALAERIREFVHDKFQTVPLPKFIRSVTVHGFDFGTIPPQLELKDITDPLPDFYEEDLDDDEEDSEEEPSPPPPPPEPARMRPGQAPWGASTRRGGGLRSDVLRNEMMGHDLGSPFLGTSTPGILGGSGLGYFQSHLGTGTHTPLAAVASAHHTNWLSVPGTPAREWGTPSHTRNPSQSSLTSVDNFKASLDPLQSLREKGSVSTLAPTSVEASRPPTRDTHLGGSAIVDDDEEEGEGEAGRRPREPRVEDVQAVFRIRYNGDIRLNLTAEILLDYPMPSFVGIPLKLNITGLTFDGVGVLAHIRKRVHFCFLGPDDALAAVGPDDTEEDSKGVAGASKNEHHKPRFGGLLQEIRVESEIGERVGGKQSLKNVGKVERFVLEQVRRIFESEFVYPSFWTFLV
ncbi:1-phosphatidylinositol-3-phosphate 5-kinase [Fusarium longipes]|uniref:Mitochondrial distribution and morphology protein 12 n=1 Tax=Fusarium longipes TaxID=694270 RepID=A0A395T6F4_9HYPO|nr:1-phosphatidylinositol-3-phosphate 5-kinase [Fusarium longipes]